MRLSIYFLFFFLCLVPLKSEAELIRVKYRPEAVDTKKGSFKEFSLKPSSFVNRILYDSDQQYLLVKLRDIFYHYCSIPEVKVEAWTSANSLGKFYHSNIKGNFDCRVFPVPEY